VTLPNTSSYTCLIGFESDNLLINQIDKYENAEWPKFGIKFDYIKFNDMVVFFAGLFISTPYALKSQQK
jgi:hypothetical protein